MDLNNSIVTKSWGYEYLLYRNSQVAIWLLNIEYNKRTSLHAHPLKNTGLVVLDGLARVSFLNNSITLKGLDKVMIFRGRFHQTLALSKRGIVILEIESPEDKFDLVRLSDDYGRENLGYETSGYREIPSDYLVISEEGEYSLLDCKIKIYKPESKRDLLGKDFETVMIFLSGGIMFEDKYLSPAGDVVSSHNLDLLLAKFDISPDTMVMEIYKD